MNKQTKGLAVCSVMAALGVVILLLGAALGLGTYVCPVIVGMSLIPVGREYGTSRQLMLWGVISVLSVLLVPDPEETLMFAGLFGWYPALRPRLQPLPPVLRIAAKLLLFNVVIVALEALVMMVLVPEVMSTPMMIALLLLGNVTFLLYDRAIPLFDVIVKKYRKR